MRKYKLAILTSHPIQYQTPLFQKLAQHPDIDLSVYFCWDFGVKEEKYNPEFGIKIKWDIPLLKGYNYKFLKNYSFKPGASFWSQINFGIIKEFIINKYDAIIIYGWASLTNLLALFITWFTRKPVFLRGVVTLKQEFLKSKKKIIIKQILLRFLFKRIDAFLSIGQESNEFYEFYGVPENKMFFVPYAIENKRFIEAFRNLNVKRNELRQKIGISSEKIVILFCGKLIIKKQPFDLLKAYEKIENENKCLIFVGDGILRKDLEDYVQKNQIKGVYFVGFKNQNHLPEYYVIGDVFVLPSGAGETWGAVVNEAMCFKLPVVVSDLVGSGRDLVKHGENGYVFPSGNVDKLVFYLKDLIVDEKKRRKFGEKSFEIINNYSYEKDIQGILKALKFVKNKIKNG